ncbi:hypothetical protein RIF29_14958 [Crotalaria pallida]|uniref:Uncharacterized protein n=1 Tax=Crotalaria pallida TaxID=3830 RepID=A0AAN9IC60_CROPI
MNVAFVIDGWALEIALNHYRKAFTELAILSRTGWTAICCRVTPSQKAQNKIRRNKQFAVVENPGFWNWTFTMKDINGEVLAQVDRDWRGGFGFEVGFWHLPFCFCNLC